ncbi:Macrophage mannose receptor 1-like protein, partial [Leptotrombidium deliense]
MRRAHVRTVLIVCVTCNKCADGWNEMHDKCVWIGSPLSHDENKLKCERMGSTMLQIESDYENQLIKKIISKSNFTASLIRMDSKYEENEKKQWFWSDGKQIFYTKWGVGEPHYDGYRCLGMHKDAYWVDMDCKNHSNIMAACQKYNYLQSGKDIRMQEALRDFGQRIRAIERTRDESRIIIRSCECPKGWHQIYLKCIWIGPSITHNDSREYCAKRNATMLRIESKDENNLMLKIFNTITDASLRYIRLDSKYESNNAKMWFWSNGSKVKYHNWAANEPHLNSDPYSCLGINRTGIWFDLVCNISTDVFVACQKMISSPVCDNTDNRSELKQTIKQLLSKIIKIGRKFDDEELKILKQMTYNNKADQETKISENFVRFGLLYKSNSTNKTYNVAFKKMNFIDAIKYCQSLNSTLLLIKSQAENTFLETKTLFNTGYWLGTIRLVAHLGYFVTTDGKELKYMNWDVTEPKPSTTSNCVY